MGCIFNGTGGLAKTIATLLSAMLCGLWLSLAAAAQSADPGITLILPPDQNPAQIEALIKTIKDTNRPITIRVEGGPAQAKPETAQAPATNAGPSQALSWFKTRRDNFVDGLALGFSGLGQLGSLAGEFADAWSANGKGGSSLIPLLGLLLAMGAGYFAVARTGPRWVRFPAAAEPDLVAKVWWRLKMVMVDALALLALVALGTLAIRLFLPDPDFVQDFAYSLMRFAVTIGIYLAIGRFLMAPDPSGFPLLPLQRAPWHLRNVVIYAALVALIIESITLLVRIGAERPAIIGWLLLVSTAAASFALWWIWNARRDIRHAIREANPDGLARRLVAAIFPAMNILGVALVWTTARLSAAAPERGDWSTAASVLLLLIAVIPILGFGVPALVDALMVRSLDDQPATPGKVAARAVARALASAGTWIAVSYAILYVWSVYVSDIDPQAALERMKILAQAGLALLAGCIIWVFFKSYLDAYAPKSSAAQALGGDEEGAGAAQGRLATILPLVRDIVLGGIIALTALVILSAIGVNIGPLLAGFGVVGLAISFGSQTLIKDIVSGAFFMVDDAFRVGEYIETGKQKGTVEKIHLRSVQLRHQNGQIHTIPFGQLDAITNYSRDWATVKFEIRLDRDADIEIARKTIKKVGLAMQQDPEMGPDLIAPLKMQGIQDITDSAMVIRLKFTAKPKNPSLLQREALKRVYRALQEAGVALASNAVTVRSPASSAFAGAAAGSTLASAPIDPRTAE